MHVHLRLRIIVLEPSGYAQGKLNNNLEVSEICCFALTCSLKSI